MELQNIDQQLKMIKPVLQEKYKVKKLGYFGSYARGEQTAESDLDILVEFSSPIGLAFVELKQFLEEVTGIRVDLVTINALKPQIKNNILDEVIYQ